MKQAHDVLGGGPKTLNLKPFALGFRAVFLVVFLRGLEPRLQGWRYFRVYDFALGCRVEGVTAFELGPGAWAQGLGLLTGVKNMGSSTFLCPNKA